MKLRWREDGAASGAENMRRDRALFDRAEKGDLVSPFLRVYAWDPPALSLGFHQNEDAVDHAALRARGFDLVRRPTGGSAVLHAEEMTYCLVAPLDSCPNGSRLLSLYDYVAESLVESLRAFGVDARRAGEGRPTGFACFASAGGHEIVVGGQKLLGSALRKGRRSYLVHGSLLVGPAHRALSELVPSVGDHSTARAEAESLRESTTDLGELGIDIVRRAWAESLASALARRAGIEVEFDSGTA